MTEKLPMSRRRIHQIGVCQVLYPKSRHLLKWFFFQFSNNMSMIYRTPKLKYWYNSNKYKFIKRVNTLTLNKTQYKKLYPYETLNFKTDPPWPPYYRIGSVFCRSHTILYHWLSFHFSFTKLKRQVSSE